MHGPLDLTILENLFDKIRNIEDHVQQTDYKNMFLTTSNLCAILGSPSSLWDVNIANLNSSYPIITNIIYETKTGILALREKLNEAITLVSRDKFSVLAKDLNFSFQTPVKNTPSCFLTAYQNNLYCETDLSKQTLCKIDGKTNFIMTRLKSMKNTLNELLTYIYFLKNMMRHNTYVLNFFIKLFPHCNVHSNFPISFDMISDCLNTKKISKRNILGYLFGSEREIDQLGQTMNKNLLLAQNELKFLNKQNIKTSGNIKILISNFDTFQSNTKISDRYLKFDGLFNRLASYYNIEFIYIKSDINHFDSQVTALNKHVKHI